MINSTKEQIGRDVICKSHLAKTDRDLYRICPSKLSKRELEDLYFALLENNLELKKTVNIQQEKLKVLSTKLQKMTAGHKNVAGKEKDCCASKALVDEQKESITDLKKTNERMAERIRVLNMRLCSAKQFLKRSPSQTTNSNKNSSRSLKNSSMSALNGKRSDSNVRSTTVFCQYSDKDLPEKETRTVETETEILPEKEVTEQSCDKNKCCTTMDELKEKITNLQQELSTSHDEYSQRIAKLEAQVSELRDENLRVRSERGASEHALQRRTQAADLLQDRLRSADAKCNELNMELAIEKRKVLELETGLKLANMSSHVVDTIEQLAAAKETKQECAPESRRQRSLGSESSQKNVDFKTLSKTSLEVPESSKQYDEVKFPTSDDSGYTELNKSCETDDNQAMVKINQELLEKIAELQTQLDILRISAAGENVQTKQNAKDFDLNENVDSKLKEKSKDFESYDVETRDEDENPMKISEDLGPMINKLKVKSKDFESYESETKDKNKNPLKISEDLGSVMNSKLKVKSKDFESYDVETKDERDENPMKNSEDLGSVMMSMEHVQQDNSFPTTETQRNKGTEPNRYESEASKGNQAKSWNSFIVPRSRENTDQSVTNDIAQSTSSGVVKNKYDAKVSRDDTHNRFQIPGPMPTANLSGSFEKREISRKTSKDSYTERYVRKKPNSEEKTVKIFEDSIEIYGDKQFKENGSAKSKDLTAIANLKELGKDLEDRRRDTLEKKLKKVSITDEEAKLAGRTPVRDSIFVNRQNLSTINLPVTNEDSAMAEVKKESITSFYLDSVCTPPKSESLGQAVQDEQNLAMYPLCESRARVCRCPALERRDVAVFRSCSGTLRFRTTSAGDRLRHCACQVHTDHFGTETDPPATPTLRNSATFTAEVPNTYTVKVEKRSRATSPENTDHEISSLSDLPLEKGAKPPATSCVSPRGALSPEQSARTALSPGEEKSTMTYTDEEALPTDYGSLSDGEMPLGEKGRRLSLGERASVTNRSPIPPPLSPSEKMEATLKSISEELARCRELLLTQRPEVMIYSSLM